MRDTQATREIHNHRERDSENTITERYIETQATSRATLGDKQMRTQSQRERSEGKQTARLMHSRT